MKITRIVSGIAGLLVLFFEPAIAASTTCYQVSTIKGSYSRTPEILCMQEESSSTFVFTLKSGLPINEKEVARFTLDHLGSARCAWCNESWYGVRNPSNSVFNTLQIRFSGRVNPETGEEDGELWIGKNAFFYRKMGSR